MKIVIIEHDESCRSKLLTLLMAQGHTVLAVTSSEDGLKLLQHERCELAIIAYDLPDNDALSLIRKCAISRPGVPLPQFVLTASREEAYLLPLLCEVRLPGLVKGFLAKPVSSSQLDALINKLRQNKKFLILASPLS